MNQLRACRPAVWLALAAMLLGAFAPTVSRALAAARSDVVPTIEVCTSEGPRWLPLAPTSADTPPADASHGQESAPSLDHCPFCLLVAERLGPPPAASVHFFNAEPGLARPDAQALFFPIFRTSPVLPRGPPAPASAT